MNTLVLTGFSPWDDYRTNASWEMLRAARPVPPRGWRVRTMELPVAWRGAWPALEAALDDDVRAVVAFGQAEDDVLRVERLARNRMARAVPDGRGVVAGGDGRILADGPATYRSGLPVARLVRALERRGLPVRASDDAGDFLCNHLFYLLMDHVRHRRAGLVAGFVHVPTLERSAPEHLATAAECIAAEVSEHVAIRTAALSGLGGSR